MVITPEFMEALSESLTPYDAVELLGMLPNTHRQWVFHSLLANPPADIDPVESAASAYSALTALEVKHLRKRIRELTNEKI